MKARLNISLTLAAACLCGLFSCVSIVSGDGTGDTAISFATPSADTKAAVVGNTLTKGSFLVWGGYRDDDGTVNATNVFNGETVTGIGGTWNYTGGTRYWVADKTYDFYAVYPADIFSGQSGALTVACSENGTLTINNFDASATGTDAVDLMTASAIGVVANDIITNGGAVELSFKHELARVNFTVTSESSVVTVSSVKVYGIAYKGSLTVDADRSEWTDLTSAQDNDTLFISNGFTLTTSDGGALSKDVFGDLLVPPLSQDMMQNANLAIAYRYSGESSDRTAVLNLGNGIASSWESGKSYNYNITVRATDLTLTITVADWNEVNTSVSW